MQDGDDLVVADLVEVAVVLADRVERLGGLEAHDLVGHRGEPLDGLGRSHRHGEQHVRGAEVPHHGDGGGRGRAGREAVVDDDDVAPGDAEPQAAVAVRLDPAVDLRELECGEVVDVLAGDVQLPAGGVVEDDDAVLADGPDGELGVAGRADLAHDQHVQLGVERLRHLEGDGQAAARQPEHEGVRAGVGGEPGGQPAAGVGAVLEHGTPPADGCPRGSDSTRIHHGTASRGREPGDSARDGKAPRIP